MAAVREYRRRAKDAYNFNWLLRIAHDLQQPFEPTHAAMAGLKLHRDSPPHQLAAELRRAFSGIVAGNVKEAGLRLIDEHGPFELHGDAELLRPLDALLASFVRQRRMKLSGDPALLSASPDALPRPPPQRVRSQTVTQYRTLAGRFGTVQPSWHQ